MATTINPYVTFDGNCEEVVKFWAEALNAKLEIMRMGDSPTPVPPDQKNKVMHATIKTDTLTLMASDTMQGQTVTKGDNVSISLNFTDQNEQRRVWDRLVAGGKPTMPLSDQFFGKFGMLKDRFGVHWMLHFQTPQK